MRHCNTPRRTVTVECTGAQHNTIRQRYDTTNAVFLCICQFLSSPPSIRLILFHLSFLFFLVLPSSYPSIHSHPPCLFFIFLTSTLDWLRYTLLFFLSRSMVSKNRHLPPNDILEGHPKEERGKIFKQDDCHTWSSIFYRYLSTSCIGEGIYALKGQIIKPKKKKNLQNICICLEV
jgi:hypothetical protein